jgi:hypothetical protein
MFGAYWLAFPDAQALGMPSRVFAASYPRSGAAWRLVFLVALVNIQWPSPVQGARSTISHRSSPHHHAESRRFVGRLTDLSLAFEPSRTHRGMIALIFYLIE